VEEEDRRRDHGTLSSPVGAGTTSLPLPMPLLLRAYARHYPACQPPVTCLLLTALPATSLLLTYRLSPPHLPPGTLLHVRASAVAWATLEDVSGRAIP